MKGVSGGGGSGGAGHQLLLLLFLLPPPAESLVCHSCECLSEKGVNVGRKGGEGALRGRKGGVTMRRGGPHPCLPGVPFVILTLHSGMEGETERQGGRNIPRERWKEIGKGEKERASVCGGAWRHSTHTHIQGKREREGEKAPRSRHSFTEIICRKGAVNMRHVHVCVCVRASVHVHTCTHICLSVGVCCLIFIQRRFMAFMHAIMLQ